MEPLFSGSNPDTPAMNRRSFISRLVRGTLGVIVGAPIVQDVFKDLTVLPEGFPLGDFYMTMWSKELIVTPLIRPLHYAEASKTFIEVTPL